MFRFNIVPSASRFFTNKAGILAIAAAGVVLPGASAFAATVGVNFVNGSDGPNNVANAEAGSLLPAETAGVGSYAQTNWNNFGRYGDVSGAVNGAGAAANLRIFWDSTDTYTDGAAVTTGDGKLMNGYLDPSYAGGVADANSGPTIYGASGNNKPLVYVGGLSNLLSSSGATSYSVILYFDGDNASENRTAERWIQSVTGDPGQSLTAGVDITPHLFSVDNSNFSGTYTQVDPAATTLATAAGGNYLIFSGLTADQILIRGSEAAGYASDPINGFQIITAVPEPATLCLFAAPLLFSLRRSRRQK